AEAERAEGAAGGIGLPARRCAVEKRLRTPTASSSGSEPSAPKCGERLATNLEKQLTSLAVGGFIRIELFFRKRGERSPRREPVRVRVALSGRRRSNDLFYVTSSV